MSDILDRFLAPTNPSNADPLDSAIAGDQSHRAAAGVLTASGSPDQAGQANVLGRDLGLPPDTVQRNLPWLQAQHQAQQARTIMGRYPIIADWGSNARNAAIMRDDLANLAENAKHWQAVTAPYGVLKEPEVPTANLWNTIKGVGTSFIEGGRQAIAGIQQFGQDFLPVPDMRQSPTVPRLRGDPLLYAKQSAEAGARVDAASPDFKSWWARGLYGGASSLAQMAPIVAAAMLTKNPEIGLGLAGGQQGFGAYGKYRARGGSKGEATLGGVLEGAAEVAGELLPMGFLINKLGKVGIGHFLTGYLGRELPGELATTLAQNATDTAIANPDKTWGEFWREQPDALVQTAVGTLVAGGFFTGLNAAAARIAPVEADRSRAADDAVLIGRAMDAATDSKVRARDPEAFRQFIAQHTDGTHAENLYIPAEKVATYFQSNDMDFRSDPFWSDYAGQIDEGLATGGDVVVPMSTAAAHLAGTPAWDAIKADTRITPGGMSLSEAESYQSRHEEIMTQLGDKMHEQMEAEKAAQEPRQKIYQQVRDQLTGVGYTQDAASVHAELVANRYATRAERMGQELTGNEATGLEVRQGVEAQPAALKQSISLVGPLPDFGVAPANIAADGKVYVGPRGASHFQVMEMYPEHDGAWTGGTGFVTPAGEFLNREQALDWVNKNGEKIRPSNMQGELDALDYREQSRLTSRQSPVYEQSATDGPRAQISFQNGKKVIDLFASRDTSSLIHELGHGWLEELREDAESPDVPDQLKADWQATQDWFKVNGHPLEDGKIPTDAHELWARGFERFAMEGKAPSSALRRVFDTFKAWLLQIYKVADNLRAPITPEIRDVMNRLLATDSEIEETRQRQNIKALFTDAAQAGMTEAEFAEYQKATGDARDEASDALLYRTMATIRASRTKAWRDEAANVKADITERINQRPEFKALHLLRTGKLLDNPEAEQIRVKLDRQWLTETYGDDILGKLPKGVPPIYADANTTNADELAELSGFASGDEMVRNLIGLEERQAQQRAEGDKRSVRQRLIDEETTAEMRDRHGDILNDGSIEEEALAAVHNDRQGEVIASELRALSRKSPHRPTPYFLAREWAARTVAESKVVDSTSGSAIQRYARAASKAGKLAEHAILKGDIDETFRQKQAQMLNNALVAEAGKAKDSVEAAVSRLSNLAKRATIKSIDQGYLDQVHGLLEQVNFRTSSQAFLDRQESFEEWAAEQTAAGHDLAVPSSFARTLGTTHWSRLTVENLLGLDDTVKQIVHFGRFKQKLIDAKVERDFNEVVDEAVSGMDGMRQRPPSDLMEPGWIDRFKSGIADADAALLRMETVFDWLDNDKSDGVFNRVVFRPIAEAQSNENDMLADYHGRIRDHLREIEGDELKRWMENFSAPELVNRETGNPFQMQRQSLIAIALNMGNEGNAQRLTDGYGWNEESVRSVLNRELSAKEWRVIQNIWDTIDTLWPQIEAMEKRINGIAPERVEARPIETPQGQLRGGYYPVIYDSARDVKTESREGAANELFGLNYTRASTNASATKARAEKVKRPILLQLGVINRHLGEVIHDLTHREAVMNADKFLSSGRIMRAVDSTLGPNMRKQFRPWLKFVANSWAVERAGNEGLGKFIQKARSNATIVGMGFRITTIMTQIAGYSNSAEVVGARWVAKGLAMSTKHPIEAFNFVTTRSGEVRHRMDTLDRDIRLAINAMAGSHSYYTAAKRFAYHGIGYADRMVVIPTWLGAYHKGLASGLSDQDASYEGDKAVRQSQGSGSPKDLAAIQRGTGKWGELLKLMTMFYSYMSTLYQRQRTLGRDARAASFADLPKLVARAWWLVAVPPVLSAILGGQGPDDDEDWGSWVFKNVLFGNVTVPVARDIARPIWDAAAGNKGFDYSLSPLQRAGQSFVNTAKDTGKIARGEETKHATRDVLETAGYATGLVPGQAAAAAQFLVDVGRGDQDPQTVAGWYRGLSTGHSEKP